VYKKSTGTRTLLQSAERPPFATLAGSKGQGLVFFFHSKKAVVLKREKQNQKMQGQTYTPHLERSEAVLERRRSSAPTVS
jgi:hypothetical protein